VLTGCSTISVSSNQDTDKRVSSGDALANDMVTSQVWNQAVRPYKGRRQLRNRNSKISWKEWTPSYSTPRGLSTQYENLAILMDTLTETECTVQVDVNENYVCHYLEKISNAYYSKEQVRIHPAVIHYKGLTVL